MRFSICELPDRLDVGSEAWAELARQLDDAKPDVALLNEMPFGPWPAASAQYDSETARRTLDAHERGLAACARLPVAAVVGSRPVAAAGRLANEAFLLAGGRYVPFHHKHYFPEEAGFYEATWFVAAHKGFDVVEYGGLRIGALLCTELMFNEWARHYRRQGAHVIVAPRAAGHVHQRWYTAAAMAAIVSGCYVLSSNRVSPDGGEAFGGHGFACAPDGTVIAETSSREPVVCVAVDCAAVRRAQAGYPCYVKEL